MLKNYNVDLIITFFVNLGCLKLKNVTDENIEVGAEKNLNWDSVYLLKCAFDDKYFIGIENNFVKIGLKEEDPFFMETLNIVKTIYLKDKIHTIRIIEKVNFEPTKDFDAIVYIDKEVYTYFKRNNIFEISLKELTKAENKKFEIDMKMLDVLENVIFENEKN